MPDGERNTSCAAGYWEYHGPACGCDHCLGKCEHFTDTRVTSPGVGA